MARKTLTHFEGISGRQISRPPRKDFLSLMEHRHSLIYLSINDEGDSLYVEDFPLSVRSPTTALISHNSDGPITYAVIKAAEQDGPVIPVKSAPGWTMGPGRMALVQFTDFSERPFFLAFDETRLSESIFALASATETYKDSENAIAMKAHGISLGTIEERFVVQIKISEDAAIHFSTTKQIAKGILERLKVLEEEGKLE